MERRNFLKTVFSLAAAAAVPGIVSAHAQSSLDSVKTPGGAVSPVGTALGANPWSQSTYLPLLNSEFQIHNGAFQVPVQLVKIDETKPIADFPQPVAQEQFSLFFSGPRESLLSQDTYTLSHPTMGTFQMFLVPVGNPTERAIYQAVIYRH